MSVLTLLVRLEKLDINIELVEGRLKIDAPKGKLTPDLIKEPHSGHRNSSFDSSDTTCSDTISVSNGTSSTISSSSSSNMAPQVEHSFAPGFKNEPHSGQR